MCHGMGIAPCLVEDFDDRTAIPEIGLTWAYILQSRLLIASLWRDCFHFAMTIPYRGMMHLFSLFPVDCTDYGSTKPLPARRHEP